MSGAFRSLVQAWLRLKPWEKSGNLFRALGIPWIDRILSQIFRDPTLSPYQPGQRRNFHELRQAFYKGQYAEVVNVMTTLIYMTLAGLFLWKGVMFGAFYAFAIIIPHVLPVPIERWKRYCIQTWLDHPDSLIHEVPPLPELRGEHAFRHWFYTPRRWESEAAYDKIRVNWFRIYVFWLSSLSNKLPGDAESTSNTLPSMRDARALDSFEQTTRLSEGMHWFGLSQYLPFLFLIPNPAAWPGLLFLLWPTSLNVYSILLQRQHRTRIFRLLLRARDKAAAKSE